MSKEQWEKQQEKYWEEADDYFVCEEDKQEYVELREAGLSEEEARRQIFESIYHQV